MGICMLRDQMVLEGVEIMDARDEEMEVGTDVMGPREEVMGMEETPGCEDKECKDVEVVCSYI